MVHLNKGLNAEDVQQMNRSLILRLIRQKGICSRANLAAATGLNQSTVTRVTRDLINWGIVAEVGLIDGRKGRRSIGLELNGTGFRVIGVRLARGYVSAGLFDLDGTEYGTDKVRIDAFSGSALAVAEMREMIARFIVASEPYKVIAIGLATPGPLFRHEGRIALMTQFPGWEHINLTNTLQKAFGIPTFIEHDANAAALAEWWLSPAPKDAGTMIYVAAGQGIGSGIIIDGAIYRGAMGTAGEIGHMSIAFDGPVCECGNRGCLELFASSTAVIDDYRKMKADRSGENDSIRETLSFEAVVQAAESGDKHALAAIQQASTYLGLGLVNVINAYNPQHIVIGDDLALAGAVVLDTVKSVLKERLLPPIYAELVVELTSFEADPVVVGASAMCAGEVLSRPTMLAEVPNVVADEAIKMTGSVKT